MKIEIGAVELAEILMTADGGCRSCVCDLVEQVARRHPQILMALESMPPGDGYLNPKDVAISVREELEHGDDEQ